MFKTKRPLALLAAVTTTAVLALVPALPSHAVEHVEDSTVSEARAFLAEYGADEVTQERLIDTYLTGGTWDSMSSVSDPVKVNKYGDADYDYSVSIYEDGSISVVREQLPVLDASIARGITGCTVSGSLRSNCKIDMWVGLVSLSFYANYNLGNNTVTSVWGPGWSIGGACGASLVYLGRPNSNIGRMDVSATMCGVPYSTTFFLQLTLRSGAASVSWG